MSFTGVKVNKENTGRHNPVADFARTAVLMLVMPDLTGIDMEYNKAHRLIQTSDADDLGLTASYDSAKIVLAYYHIEEFFRIAPEGILQVIPVVKDTIIAMASGIDVIPFSARVIGLSDYVSDDDGLEKDVQAMQTIINGARDNMIYISSGVIGSIDKTKDLRTFASENVSVCIAKDPITNNIIAANKLAAIGSVLGGLCVRQVSENLGSVDINNKPDGFIGQRDYPLTNIISGRWLSASLTDLTGALSMTPTTANDLTARGYIFASSYLGYAGVFFNSSPTCTILESDYAYVERNATWDKAAILVRDALIPKIKGKLPKRNGKIIPTKIQELKNLAMASLQEMFSSNEIDEAIISIDGNQTVSETQPLEVSMKVSVGDILHEIRLSLAVVNQL